MRTYKEKTHQPGHVKAVGDAAAIPPGRITPGRMFAAIALLIGSIGLAGCQEEGPAERAGEQIDEAMDDVADRTEQLADETEDLADEVEDEIDDAADAVDRQLNQ